MRRVITFALVVALTYLGVGAFAPAQPMSRPGTAAARLTALAGRPGFKTVRYAGYTIRVPASWPVYRLDRDPGRCVRYDQHAVYLGQPGANQQCPAHLVGHTATISIEAAAPGSGGSGPGAGGPGGPGTGSPVDVGPAIGTVPQVGGSVTRNAQDQQLSASLADPGVSVTGTYTGGGGRVLSILRSLRRAATGAAQASAAQASAAQASAAQASEAQASAAQGRSRGQVMTRWAAALATGSGHTVPSPHAAVTLRTTSAAGAAVTLRSTHPGQHRHHRAHRARRHRQARKHPGSRHKASRPKTSRHGAAKHHNRKHAASHHRARKHQARKHKARKHRARKHRASKHRASKHRASKHRASKHQARKHRARKHRAHGHHARKHQRARHRGHPRIPRLRQGLRGFDSCTTPSLSAMRAWRRTFSATAVYIGGVEAGCASPNLTAGWVRAMTGMGWSLMPTYVGRQASCSSFTVRIRPARAVGQGQAAALDAIHQAAALGMGRDTPIYYDMEAYHGHRRCRNATLAFLDAWTRTLHAHGYRSGVYSSASSGAENLGWAHTVNGRRIAKPDSMWFGLWDNERNVRGLPYLLQGWWRGPRRIKQYEGPHHRTVGGYTLDIDSDWVYGAVYR
jgi:hypothetical protein